MKLRSAPILGCVTLLLTLAMDVRFDCKDMAGAGLLDGLWFVAATEASNQGDAQLQSEIDGLQDAVDNMHGQPGVDGVDGADGARGAPGAPGADGLSCWDLDGDGEADPEEDINDDGVWDTLDCQGADGTDGTNGTNGTNGTDGTSVQCWNIVGDFNGDGTEDTQDCTDFREHGGDASGIVASAVIDEYGFVRTGARNIDGAFGGGNCWYDVGRYQIEIDLGDTKLDLSTVDAEDYAIFITIRATSATFPPGQTISALVGHYLFERYDGQPAFDKANKKLSMEIYILRSVDGEYYPAEFSILVVEPTQ